MEKQYKYHEHTADITVECWGATLEDAFENAALAAMDVIVDINTVKPERSIDIEVTGIDLKELLVEWIGQILALIDIEIMFFSKFEIIDISENGDGFVLRGRAYGESIDPDNHDIHTEVKAMTYADLRIERTSDKTTIWFTLDL